MSMQFGVPLKLLKEFEGKKITVEASSGDVYRGVLNEVEENMSVSLSAVKAILNDGRTTEMASVYVKGSRIRLLNLPDSANSILSNLIRQSSFRPGGRGFRGGRGRGGAGSGGGGRRYGSSDKPSYDRRRY